ncbi:MAG: WecB/TagA/CpsF family glycosyltransferase [Clostridia bacterium]|nr:WecB/TagA/CpsF family glycosyltransferase [Clostridia bacterium]
MEKKELARIRLCGVTIHDLTLDEAVEAALEKRGEPCFAVTPNALMLEACRKCSDSAALLNRATLSLPDGAGVLLAAKRQKTPLRARVAGIEFGEALLRRAAEEGLRVFLLGGKAGVAQRAAERLEARFPGLSVCGSYWGYFERTDEEDRALCDHIRACRPDLLFVCFGFPTQEKWIAEHLDRLSALRVVAGLGGSLDVWAGDVRRAPAPLSRLGLEWAWRMLLQPKRLKKLPAIVRFVVRGGK